MFLSKIMELLKTFYIEIKKKLDTKANKADVDKSIKDIKTLLGEGEGGDSETPSIVNSITNLNNSVDTINNEIDTMNSSIDNINSDITSIRSGMTTMSSKLDVAKADILSNTQKASANETSITNLQNSLTNYVTKDSITDITEAQLTALLDAADNEG